jgi:hypothetical protein
VLLELARDAEGFRMLGRIQGVDASLLD